MLTFIDTNKLTGEKTPQGKVTEILNHTLCGSKNVVAIIRSLEPHESFRGEASEKHQLLYLLEGKGIIGLYGRDYEVSKGAGVYLGPSETATMEPAGGGSLKILHLFVPNNLK